MDREEDRGLEFRPPPSALTQYITGPSGRMAGIFRLKRSNNHNTLKVKMKVFARLLKDIENLGFENETGVVDVIKEYLNKLLPNPRYKFGAAGIDMCHGESYAQMTEFMEKLIRVAPKCSPLEKQKLQHSAEGYCNALISTDDESSTAHAKKTITQCLDPAVDEAELHENLQTLLNILNKASRNILPGVAKINRSIGAHPDPHIVGYNKDGCPVMPVRSQKIWQASDSFASDLGLPAPEPKRNEDNNILSSTALIIPDGTTSQILPSKHPITSAKYAVFSSKKSKFSPPQPFTSHETTTNSSSSSSSSLAG